MHLLKINTGTHKKVVDEKSYGERDWEVELVSANISEKTVTKWLRFVMLLSLF